MPIPLCPGEKSPAAGGAVRRTSVALGDLVELAAVVEVLLLRRLPAAEHLVDREQADRLEGGGVFLRHRLRARTREVLGGDFLARFRIQELQVGGGLLADAAAVGHRVDHRHRRFGQDRGLARSSQFLICFGLPLRTRYTMVE